MPAQTLALPIAADVIAVVPKRPMSPRLRGDLEFALVAADLGRPELARRIVAVVETAAGVTDADRLRHGDPQAKTRRLVGLANKLAEQRAKAGIAEAPKPAGPVLGPTAAEIKRLAKADRKIAEARAAGDYEALNKAADAKAAVYRDMERRDAAAYLAGRRAELAELERLRGGEVIVEERVIDTPVLRNGAPRWKDGRIVTRQETVDRTRITNRDGLEVLAGNAQFDAKGKMTRPPTLDGLHLAAGEHYRDLYEATDPEKGLTPPNPDRGGGRAGDPFGARAIASAQSRARMRAIIERLEAMVQAEAGARGLWVLREVAGKGMTINALGGGGSARKRNTDSLTHALDVLVDAFGLS